MLDDHERPSEAPGRTENLGSWPWMTPDNHKTGWVKGIAEANEVLEGRWAAPVAELGVVGMGMEKRMF